MVSAILVDNFPAVFPPLPHTQRRRATRIVAHARRRRNVYDSAMAFDEQACVNRARRNDGDAFAMLVDHYMPRIYAHLYRMLGNREDAEDVAQETFVRAYAHLDRYDPARPFRNWIYTIASNLARNHLRKRSAAGQGVPLDEARAEAGTTPDYAAATREQSDRINAALDRLTPNAAVLVQLHYREGFTIGEAADILGMTENAAKVALHRARKQLRNLLVEDDHDGA
jgi:RNA polymerase sigma-70 factor (ECF subfamily)